MWSKIITVILQGKTGARIGKGGRIGKVEGCSPTELYHENKN